MFDLLVRMAKLVALATMWLASLLLAFGALVAAQQVIVGGEALTTKQASSSLCLIAGGYWYLSALACWERQSLLMKTSVATFRALVGLWFGYSLTWLLVPIGAAALPLFCRFRGIHLDTPARDSIFVCGAMLGAGLGWLIRCAWEWRSAERCWTSADDDA